MYTLAFLRYADKTQVFSYKENDHITKRIMHVLYVSKIARTIGRALNLNEDLIEAAGLGHDLGHTPFGHVGEAILNEISLNANEGYFNHNVHSVRLLREIENHGKGVNITLQTLDAIMCHNGEFVQGKYEPVKKSKEDFFREYENTYKDKEQIKKLIPMTLEGCVVRISDLIAYLGRDIEDAIRMNLVTFDDLPITITKVLGKSNREIVNTIITDVIKNSKDKNYIELSSDVYEAIVELKDFNYKFIYYKAYSDEEKAYLKKMMVDLFNMYMNDLKTNKEDSNIIKSYLKNMSDEYKKNTNARIVIDYIAGMTDDYIKNEYNKILEKSHNNLEVA
jgi:dGTPase